MIVALKKMMSTDKTMVVLDQAIFSGATFLTILVFTRVLSLQDFGIFATMQLYAFLLMSISGACVIQPMQVLYGKYKENRTYLSTTFLLQIALLLLLALFIFIIQFFAKETISQWSPVLLPASGFALLTIYFDYVRKRLLVESKLLTLLKIELLVAFLQIGLAILGYYFSIDIVGVLWLMVLSFLPVIIWSTIMFSFEKMEVNSIVYFIKLHWNHVKWLAPTAIIQWLTSNFFVAASGLILGVEALGAFRLVQTLFGMINVLLQGIESYVLPQAAIRFKDSTHEAYAYLNKMAKKALLPITLILLFLFVFADKLIYVLGGDAYSDYGFVIRWMVALHIMILLNYPIRMLIRLHELNHLFLAGYVISFIASLLSAHYLLSKYQLTGAIIGLSVNQILLFALWQYSLTKKEISLWK